MISESNAFIFNGGVQATFNPNWTWGTITIYPALVEGGIDLNVTDAIPSLTYNKILTSNNRYSKLKYNSW